MEGDLREFQEQALEQLGKGRSALIVAPTGLGKTRAALLPYVKAKENYQELLGTRLLYSLPLRALTQGVREELEALYAENAIRGLIAVHYGGRLESEIFSEPACITTVDQYFTAFAGAPLSFAMNSGHAVAGAILTSYSVFDEVHLLSPEKGLPLLFAILKLRQRWGLVSAVMTATLPDSVIQYFEQHLELETIPLAQADIAARDSWRKVTIEYEDVLSLDQLAQLAQEKWATSKRVIVFMNTVERAIRLYERLNENGIGQDQLLLIHARFAPEHRKQKEEQVSERLGKESRWEGVLVTTQVAEAGLNISAPVVISELAPADSLTQRVGRCTRFQPEGKQEVRGEVIVVKPEGERAYLPYNRDVVESTEVVLKAIKGEPLNWELEKKFINDSVDGYYKFFVRGEIPFPEEASDAQEE